MSSQSAPERDSANIARLLASRRLIFGAEVVICRNGSSDVISDTHPEPTKSAVDPTLIEGVYHACSYPPPPWPGVLRGVLRGRGGCDEVCR